VATNPFEQELTRLNIQFNSIQYLFFTKLDETWEISLWADKKLETKGYKNANIAPGMHYGYRGRVQEQNLNNIY